MAARLALLGEIVGMALDTLRANKLRSALTILGVVIGVTSIVAMTALIRGFGEQIYGLIRELGSESVFVSKMSIESFSSGKDFWDLMKRPDLTEADAKAIREGAPSAGAVAYHLGEGPGGQALRITYRTNSTRAVGIIGASANWMETNFLRLAEGRFLSEFEVHRKRSVVVLGASPAKVLFPSMDPLGKRVRIGQNEYTVVGVLAERPTPLGGDSNAFAVIPATTYEKVFETPRLRGYLLRFMVLGIVAREGATRDDLRKEVEQILRSRHRLRLDQENDFDILTSDSLIGIVDQLTRAVVLALVVISSIALMVGGIGVMAIMTISVTERTREIGVRKAMGAKRREVLWQFLIEAVVLTSLGGLLGVALGAGIGLTVNWLAGFPISMPLWSFALGIGFSSLVGIFFGMYPAFKAARLDPIEALRYE